MSRDPAAEDRLYDAAVVGAGPAGLAAALALNYIGAHVALIGPLPEARSDRRDTRTAALLAGSIDMLKAIGVWTGLAPHAAPLKAIRIIDASNSLLRAPEIIFEARELGLEAFGYNIPNTVLVETLYARARESLGAVIAVNVKDLALGEHEARLDLNEGAPVAARLVVGADGHQSLCREAAGIAASKWRYEQSALATDFKHVFPHDGVSTELHKEAGSVTTVPLPNPCASSLIWVGPTAEIAALMRLDTETFREALQERLGGLLGRISENGARAEFPVAGLTAATLAANRTALVGEAAHILPPIGAQGLNLGLRDAAALADCVATALRQGNDPGGEAVLAAYRDTRRLDVLTRAVGVDLLSRSLLSGLMPIQAARGLFLHGLNALPPLRRMVMRLGLTPPTELPSLMRPAAN
jgi:2-octaprenyl-6-methoxyphenol hydroxylase